MSGVLFVVYIPSKEIEKSIRQKYGNTEDVTEEKEKYQGATGGNDHTPLTTPEMQQRNLLKVNICSRLNLFDPDLVAYLFIYLISITMLFLFLFF